MAYEGPGTYYMYTALGDGASNQNRHMQNTDPGAVDTNTRTPTVNTSGGGDYLMIPLAGAFKTAFTTNPQDKGWNMKVVNTDAADGVTKRRIPAGTWSLLGTVGIQSGAGYPNADTTVKINVYKRTLTPTFTFIGTLTGTGRPVTLNPAEITATASLPEVQLSPGETLQFEVWLNVPNASLTNYLLRYEIGTGNGLTLPGAGLRYFITKAVAATQTTAANAAKQFIGPAKVGVATSAAAFNTALTLFRTLVGTGTGLASIILKITFARFFTAPSTAIAIYDRRLSALRNFGSFATSVAFANKQLTMQRAFLSTASALASLTTRLTLFRNLVGTSAPIAAFSRISTLKRSFSSNATAVAVYNRALSLNRSFVATATGLAFINKLLTIKRQATGTSTGVATAVTRLTLFRTLTGTSTAVAIYNRVATLKRSFTASATPVAANPRFFISLRPLVATATAVAFRRGFVIGKAYTASATAVGIAAKLLSKNATAAATAVAAYARAITFRRTFTGTASGLAKMAALIPQVVLNRMTSGGGTTIIKKIINIFDD